jgi:molybdate-binding protein
LVSVTRSSREALALLAAGSVHVAGAHLSKLSPVRGRRSLRMAVWESGLALAPGAKVGARSARALLRLRWASRAPGSGARECMDQLLDGDEPAHQKLALDHREVAASIRSGWADAGICIRLTAAEAGLEFSAVRREAYELCHAESLDGDPRLVALFEVLRSRDFRAMLGELPGYDSRSTGELRIST